MKNGTKDDFVLLYSYDIVLSLPSIMKDLIRATLVWSFFSAIFDKYIFGCYQFFLVHSVGEFELHSNFT